MKSGIMTIYNGMPKLLKSIEEFPKHDVLIGIPEDKSLRDYDADENEPITNAAIGYIAEFGAPERNIPQRAWLIPSIKKAKVQISSYMKQAGAAILAGDYKKCDRAMHAAGLAGQNSARKMINTGPFQELAEATLAARLRRGRTGTKPLIDTGQFRNSVTYVVRNGK